MFINCPYCKALVATDPATDLPPEQCPRCAAKLRAPPAGPRDGVAVIDAAPDLERPVEIAPPPIATQAPAELPLSSQIHRIVADAASTPASSLAAPAIVPISVLLKAKADAATPTAETPTRTGPEPVPAAPVPAADPESATQVPTDAGKAAASPAAMPDPGPESASTDTTTPDNRARDVPTAITTPPGNSTAPAPTAKPLPSFAHRGTATARSGFDWKVSTAVAALASLLLLQLLLADRTRLAADARWRPLVSTLCRVSGCALPPWREPAAFAVLARDVRPHPTAPGALRVTATFRNDARWPQPWPQLRLTLSDIDGNAVASRDFSARDYLGAAPSAAGLASGQSASIAMDIVEPSARSVAFDFQLH